MTELPLKACWRAKDVSAVINNEALEGHEGIFLATHTPIRGFTVSGSHAGEITGRDERSVLAALSDPARRHAFCVVQGEPGSGKSHLIRWLSVNWQQPGDVKLLLQRADGSLEGALRQLRERLPTEFQELFDKLGRRHRVAEKGRANLFLVNLATALDPGHFDPPFEDDDWCASNRPSDLVGHVAVKREWDGPARILRLLEGGGSDLSEERNSESASFNLFDIEDLAKCCVGIRGTGVLPATERLALRLLKEADTIEAYRNNDWTADEVEREHRHQFRTSVQLMDALNRRRNDAIQNLLGVSAEGLKQLFRQIRRALAARGQRLVLLLEDITSWEGIDDSLIDVLVTNSETRGADGEPDMCPLISVVGVTPTYYHRLPGNYRGRITHEIRLGEAKSESELQDVATLRDGAERLSFAARYLAAVRTGEASLNQWREKLRDDADLKPPNKCDDCPVREGCHAVFGAKDKNGFYPFTANALERLFAALNDRDDGMTWKTPRGILQAILSPNLLQPDAIEEGAFPTILLENKALVSDSRVLTGRLDRIVDAADLDDEDATRIRRFLAYWGDKNRADTIRLQNGELAFADVPAGVFSALRLPWIGEETESVSVGDRPSATPVPPLAPKKESPSAGPKAPPVTAPPSRDVSEPPSKRRRATRPELERRRAQLKAWDETGNLEEPAEWNKILYDLVRSVEPRQAGIDPLTFQRLFTPERVKIEGTGPAQRGYFGVKPERWVLDGLEAYIALRLDVNKSAADDEFHRRNLAVLLRRLEQQAANYADRRLSLVSGGHRWNPVTTFIQLLLARSWLRGTAFADDPPQAQLRVLLSDEAEAESDPTARCMPWREFLEKTKDWHDRFRSGLRTMLGTPQGESRGFGLADVSAAAPAIQRLCRTLKFDPVPTDSFDTGVIEYNKARDLIAGMEGGLTRIIRIERDQIQQRAGNLQALLRGRSIRDHLLRVDLNLEEVAKRLPNAAPDQVKSWKMAYAKAKSRLESGVDTRIEDLLMTFSVGSEGPPTQNASLLAWLSRAPARDLEDFRSLSQLGEQAVATVLEHVLDCIREGGGSVSLDDVHKVGRLLRAAVHPPKKG